MSSIRRVIGVLGVVVLSVLSAAAFAGPSLDGTKWRIEITPEGAPIPHHIDRDLFGGGAFTSVIFERKGFPAASYTATEKDGVISWQVKQQSDTQGELVWQGEVAGEALTGTLVWTQKDGKVVKHALVGAPPPPEEESAAADASKTAASKSSWFKSWGCSKK